jgi:hypothetical protein
MARIVAAIVLAVLLGFAAAHMLALQWFTLVPWGIAGIALGLGATRFKAILAGAIYGFILCFVFMLAGYSGAAPIVTRLPFFAVIGVFGAVCGIAVSWIGSMLKRPSTPNAA